MKDETLKYLHDIREAVLAIIQFVEGKTFEAYTGDELIRSGVERKSHELLYGVAQISIHKCSANGHCLINPAFK